MDFKLTEEQADFIETKQQNNYLFMEKHAYWWNYSLHCI